MPAARPFCAHRLDSPEHAWPRGRRELGPLRCRHQVLARGRPAGGSAAVARPATQLPPRARTPRGHSGEGGAGREAWRVVGPAALRPRGARQSRPPPPNPALPGLAALARDSRPAATATTGALCWRVATARVDHAPPSPTVGATPSMLKTDSRSDLEAKTTQLMKSLGSCLLYASSSVALSLVNKVRRRCRRRLPPAADPRACAGRPFVLQLQVPFRPAHLPAGVRLLDMPHRQGDERQAATAPTRAPALRGSRPRPGASLRPAPPAAQYFGIIDVADITSANLRRCAAPRPPAPLAARRAPPLPALTPRLLPASAAQHRSRLRSLRLQRRRWLRGSSPRKDPHLPLLAPHHHHFHPRHGVLHSRQDRELAHRVRGPRRCPPFPPATHAPAAPAATPCCWSRRAPCSPAGTTLMPTTSATSSSSSTTCAPRSTSHRWVGRVSPRGTRTTLTSPPPRRALPPSPPPPRRRPRS